VNEDQVEQRQGSLSVGVKTQSNKDKGVFLREFIQGVLQLHLHPCHNPGQSFQILSHVSQFAPIISDCKTLAPKIRTGLSGQEWTQLRPSYDSVKAAVEKPCSLLGYHQREIVV